MINIKKALLYGFLGLILVGCGAATSHYMLTGSAHSGKYYTKKMPVIGVEKITVPEYMKQGTVAIQLSPTQISYNKSAEWVEDMESSLTKQLIETIQKSFNQPNVYLYPWGLSKQAGIKINISIGRFIAYGDFVYLDATWKINDLRRGKEYSRLFSIKVPSGRDTASVVAGMNVAFGKLSAQLIKDLNSRF